MFTFRKEAEKGVLDQLILQGTVLTQDITIHHRTHKTQIRFTRIEPHPYSLWKKWDGSLNFTAPSMAVCSLILYVLPLLRAAWSGRSQRPSYCLDHPPSGPSAHGSSQDATVWFHSPGQGWSWVSGIVGCLDYWLSSAYSLCPKQVKKRNLFP